MRFMTRKQQDSMKRYRGYKIETKPSTHVRLLEMITPVGRDASILVLGSGEGAFEARLFDNGFKDIYSSEHDIKVLKFRSQKQVFELDLNQHDFHSRIKKQFDVVVASDVIEHLYSPQAFLASCYSLLKKDGLLLLSTPNIHSTVSRLFFLLTGYPHKFHYKEIRKWEHFSPIMKRHFIFQAKELRFKKLFFIPCCNYLETIVIHNLRSFLAWAVALPFLAVLYLIGRDGLYTEWIIRLEK